MAEARGANVELFRILAESASMQGRRPKQEDRKVMIPDLTKAAKALKMPIDHLDQPCAFFAVYDGHQGHLCSEFVAKSFHGKLLKKLSADTNKESWTEERFTSLFKEICEELDTEFLAKFRTAPDGCTVVVALITGTRLFVAWVGDSRCVVAQRSDEGFIVPVPLTEDHRPDIEAEAERVTKAGGIIVDLSGFGLLRVAHTGYEERIREIRRAQAMGMGVIGKEPIALAVTRALGDREFKAVTGRALLVPTPDVKCFRLNQRHKFMALMCDGIPDVMTDDEALAELERTRQSQRVGDAAAKARAACGALVQEAYKRESQDNLTVVLVQLIWPGPPDEFVLQAKVDEKAAAAAGKRSIDHTAVVASKKRRQEAAANISAQKHAAYEKAISAEAAKAPANGGTTEEANPEASPPEPEKGEEAKKDGGEDQAEEEMTFL